MFDRFDRLSRTHVGLPALIAIGIFAAIVTGCVVLGGRFTQYQATAMLQFPGESKPGPRENDAGNVIELPEYKRVAALYDSTEKLAAYLNAIGAHDSAAAQLLLKGWESTAAFSVTPVLPISRREQKEFGYLKGPVSVSLLGLELKASGPTREIAAEVINILACYYTNIVLRERIRTWLVNEKVRTISSARSMQANILRAELAIEFDTRRAQEMKTILERHPAAAQMDTRQVVSLNVQEGGERFLSPLAQLVGAESAISNRREFILRLQRDLNQGQLLAKFYVPAEPLVDQLPDTNQLLARLIELAREILPKENASDEWAREATLIVSGALDSFGAMRSQFGIRRDVRVGPAPNRSPLRLIVMGTFLAVIFFAAVVVMRAGARALRSPTRG